MSNLTHKLVTVDATIRIQVLMPVDADVSEFMNETDATILSTTDGCVIRDTENYDFQVVSSRLTDSEGGNEPLRY